MLVDDRLPCGADGKPCFGHCPTEGVLWAAIVEKALAKLLGSYEATCHIGVEDGECCHAIRVGITVCAP